MVRLEPVEDEHFAEPQPAYAGAEALFSEKPGEEDEDYATTDSEGSSSDDDDLFEETLYDRFVALKDIIPPKARNTISGAVGSVYSGVTSTLGFGGRALYVLGTVVLMIGVPFAVAVSEEQQMIEMEKEMKVCEVD